MEQPIEAVAFDFGRVLSCPPEQRHVEAVRSLTGLDRRRFTRAYTRERTDYDRGLIDARRYWERVLAEGAGPSLPALTEALVSELVQRDLLSWSRINRSVLAWARLLRSSGRRIAVLSNMPPELMQGMMERFTWLREFDALIFSCRLGSIKPEEGIYRACLEALGVAPQRLLFLDDSAANVEGARALGIQAFVFRSLDDRVAELARRLALPAPHLFARGSAG
jgi:putative hydrolase of the HAD superfamily